MILQQEFILRDSHWHIVGKNKEGKEVKYSKPMSGLADAWSEKHIVHRFSEIVEYTSIVHCDGSDCPSQWDIKQRDNHYHAFIKFDDGTEDILKHKICHMKEATDFATNVNVIYDKVIRVFDIWPCRTMRECPADPFAL